MRHHGSLREIASGSAVTLTGVALHFCLQYVLWITVSRFWGAAGLGIFVTGLTILWFGGGLFRLGLSQGTLRYVAMLKGGGREGAVRPLLLGVGRVALLSSLVGGALLLALAGPIGALLHKPALTGVLRVLAAGVVVWNLLFVGVFAIQGLRTMKWMVLVRDISQPGLALGMVAAAGLLGFSLMGATVAFVLSLLPALGLVGFALVRLLRRAPAADPPRLREVLLFSFPLIWTQLVSWGVRQQEILVAAYFLPAAQVGLYGASLKTAALVGFTLQATNAIFSPLLAHLHGTGELEHLRSLYRTVARWCFTLALPIFLGCLLFGHELLGLWGPEFVAAWPALVLLAGAQLVNVSTGAAGSMLIMGARQKIELANSILALILGLALDILLIPRFGILGAAVGAGVSMSAVNLLRVVQVQRLWGANPFSVHYLKPLTVGAFSAAALYGVERWGIAALGWGPRAGLAIGLPLLGLLYLCGLRLAGFEADDREVAKSLLRRGRRQGREEEWKRPRTFDMTAPGADRLEDASAGVLSEGAAGGALLEKEPASVDPGRRARVYTGLLQDGTPGPPRRS